MKRKNASRNALITSIISLLLCVSMLVGTTFAWFTDEVVSANNIIASGNLDVEMYWADGTEAVPTEDSGWTDASTGAIFNYSLWEPGYTEVRHIKIANVGNLALQYSLQIVPNGEVSELADVIDVYYTDPAAQVENRTKLEDANKIGTLTEALAGMSTTANGKLQAETEVTITLALKMQESAGNEYQNMSIGSEFSVVLLATQVMEEEDSFNNEYDEESTEPLYAQGKKLEGKSLTVGETGVAKIQIPADAPIGTYSIVTANKHDPTDANGVTVLSVDISLLKDGVEVEAADGIEYTVAIYLDPFESVTSVTHNGVNIGNFTPSNLNGYVKFTTSSFSPFAVTYTKMSEEEIGKLNPDAKYMSTGMDIHSSTTKSGAFQLISDIKTSDYGDDARYGYGYEYIIRNQADYTLDLNGKTITHDTVNENANKNAFTYTFVANNAGTKLTIGGEGKVVAENSAGYTCVLQGKDGTLITVNGGEYEARDGIAVWAGAGSHIVINDGTFVNDGAKEAKTDHELIYSSGGVIDIYGGFFHNKDGNYTLNVEDNNRKTGFINVYGGTYVNFNPATGGQDPNNIKVAEGYKVVSETQANGDVWYTVVEDSVTVSSAKELTQALNGETAVVKLAADVTLTNENVAVAAGAKAILDLNGKTLTVTNTESEASCAIENKGELKIKNGTITYQGVGDPNFGYGTNTINNTGKLIIDGATIVNTTTSGSSVAIDCSAGAELIVNSGEIKSEKNAIRLCPFGNGEINCTITGGTITGARAVQIHLPSSDATSAPVINLTVKGGTFNGTSGMSIYSYSYGQSFANVNVTLAGGIFNNDVVFGGGSLDTQENVTVTGGTFNGELGRYVEADVANNGWQEIEKP